MFFRIDKATFGPLDLDEEVALKRWFRACADLTTIKLRKGQSGPDWPLLVREAEERIEKAAETYAEVVHASIQDADLVPGTASGRRRASR